MSGLRLAFFGSSLVSSYWNGAATYYRGLLRALASRGVAVRFYEPDAYERQQHRDIPDPAWAEVRVYPATLDAVERALDEAVSWADVLVKASGVGVFDEWLESSLIERARPGQTRVFWDVDAPATLERLDENPEDPFHRVLGRYHVVFTYGGGEPVVAAYTRLGARECLPIYNALDPDTHFPVPPDSRFAADLTFLGNRLPDREARVAEFFLDVARHRHAASFLLGGSGWQPEHLPANVRWLGHVGTSDHNTLNVSARAVLNINRESMARYGFSPATRVFEAAGAGACLITDAWPGVDSFLEPGREILVASGGDEVASRLDEVDASRARAIGDAARRRVLAHHTYAHRADKVLGWLTGSAAAA